MTSAARARCSCSARRSSSTAPATISRCSSSMACRTRCSIPPAASRPSRRSPTSKDKFVGGLRLPQDETGDCHMFTQALADEAAELGVQFKFNTAHRAAGRGRRQDHRRRHQRRAVAGRRLCRRARQLVAAAAASRSAFRVPVYPVKGYSITVPITDADGAPVSTVMDESYKVAITRLGDRIRVGGTAEISGYSDQPRRGAARDARSFADRPVSARRRSGARRPSGAACAR